MHMVIKAIVYATNPEEALDNARSIFDNLCERGTFDYFTMFDETGSSVSGRGRWGDLIPVANEDSPEGIKLVNEGWESTVSDFNEAMEEIRKNIILLTNEEIMEEQGDSFLIRYRFHQIGQYEGSEIWLYDNDGSGIRSKHHLNNALNKWPDLKAVSEEDAGKYDGLDVWVVPTDVHY